MERRLQKAVTGNIRRASLVDDAEDVAGRGWDAALGKVTGVKENCMSMPATPKTAPCFQDLQFAESTFRVPHPLQSIF